ncbi:MAG: HAD family hydrolase [Anaerohalosphaeraceae bacterium]|nr:HAD family hydrolase [Anaerohalosphaeraceae bacterium]
MIKCVAFDMDDTLYDELDYYKSGLTAVAQTIACDNKLDNDAVFSTIWGIFTNGNHKTTFNETLEKLTISYGSDYIHKLVDVLRCHPPQITLPPDSRITLEKLKGKYKLALITDGFLPAQRYKVAALDIEKYFDCIIYTEELGREFWKPSPAAFEKMMRLLDVKASQCVYVGDNLQKDFLAPNRLGFKTIKITRSRGIHKSAAPEKDALADCEIDEISKLSELLEE